MIISAVPKYGEVVDYTVDYTSDISSLPEYDRERGNGGSTAFVIDGSLVYMLGTAGWRTI